MTAGGDQGKNFSCGENFRLYGTHLIIDVDIHTLPEKLSELIDVSLAFITKL